MPICGFCGDSCEALFKMPQYDDEMCANCKADFEDRIKSAKLAPAQVQHNMPMKDRVAKVMEVANGTGKKPTEQLLETRKEPAKDVPKESAENTIKKTKSHKSKDYYKKNFDRCLGCNKIKYLLKDSRKCGDCSKMVPSVHSNPVVDKPVVEVAKEADFLDGLSFYTPYRSLAVPLVTIRKDVCRFTTPAIHLLDLTAEMHFHLYYNKDRLVLQLKVQKDSNTIRLNKEGNGGLRFNIGGLFTKFPEMPVGAFLGRWERKGKDRYLVIDFNTRQGEA